MGITFDNGNGKKSEIESTYNIGEQYKHSEYNLTDFHFFGCKSAESFNRVTAIHANHMEYESIITGQDKSWLSFAIRIDGNDVELDLITQAYGAKQFSKKTIHGIIAN